MGVTRVRDLHRCAICERTLLMGERPVRFAPNGDDLVEVCQLCQDAAFAAGWSREGAPFTPTLEPPRRRSRLSIGALLGARPVAEQQIGRAHV